MTVNLAWPIGGGAPFTTQGNDLEINGKQYPGVILNPISTETNGLYSVLREINGSQWLMQNADIGGGGFFIINPASPAWAFTLLQGGGLAMYTAPGNSSPGFVWTRLFFVDNTGTVQSPTSGPSTVVFPTDFSGMTIYNYGHYVGVPNLAATPNTAALATMLAAMTSAPGLRGGMGWIPHYQFQVSASDAGLAVPSGAILQGLGAGGGVGSSMQQFVITDTDASGQTFFMGSGPHSSSGTFFNNLGFKWVGALNVNDTAVHFQTWAGTLNDCSFEDCPRAFQFGQAAPSDLSSAAIRCKITYQAGPNNATAVVMAGNQAACQGPSEYFQRPVISGGPTGCTCIAIGGGFSRSEHPLVENLHITNWTTGIDFQDLNNSGIGSGTQKGVISGNEIQCLGSAINMKTIDSNGAVLYYHVTDNDLIKSQASSMGNPIMTVSTNGGPGAHISALTLADNNIFSNVDGTEGTAQPNQYGLQITSASDLVVSGGQIGNVGTNSKPDGTAAIVLGPTPFWNTADPFNIGGSLLFTGICLKPNVANAGGGGGGAGNSQWAVLATSVIPNNGVKVKFVDCDMTGYGAAGPISIAGPVPDGTLFIRNCDGYNDQNTLLNANVAPIGTPISAAHCTTPYFGPSMILWDNGPTTNPPITVTVQGRALGPATTGQITLASPYDTVLFSVTPLNFRWYGK